MNNQNRAVQQTAGGFFIGKIESKADKAAARAEARAENKAEKAAAKAEAKAEKEAAKAQKEAETAAKNGPTEEPGGSQTETKTDVAVVKNTPDMSGDDWLDGNADSHKMDGEIGIDTVNYVASAEGVEVNLTTGEGKFGDAEGDLYANIENVHGSNFDDLIIGNEQDNRLVGRDGDDTLRGEDGNDYLIGGRGADILDGGAGVDTAEYDWSTSGVDVNLTTGAGQGGFAEGDILLNIENLNGSYHDDVLTGDDGVNRLFGDDGDDVLNGMSGDDIMIGGQGADVFNGGDGDRDAADYQTADAGVSVDLVNGGFGGEADGDSFTGVEYVYGSSYNDTIIGDDGVNRLVGGAGDDDLQGAGGNDYVLGGVGNDTMTGGTGADVFQLAVGFGDDTITDFEFGAGRTDRIWFRGLDLQESDLVMTDSADGVLIDAGGLGTLLLEGVAAGDLHSDDFIF